MYKRIFLLTLFWTPLIFCHYLDDRGSSNYIANEINSKSEIRLALGSLKSSQYGVVLYVSPQFIYQFNKMYQIKLLYRTGVGLSGLSFGEQRYDLQDKIHVYREISSLIDFVFYEEYLSMRFGAGLGFIWGKNSNSNKFGYLVLPIAAGLNFDFSHNTSGGIDILSNIASKTIFWGYGLNFTYNF